ncbi:hypothetical protein [Phytohabitans rumicis]|uniref:Uncharacterized protein n=1 Tax=Phytohabitans rumicis TaxID=1076125 RepID=A0A6V8LFQ2_9ACTN|nr:hypothetical protein [Phytohabitans rumicis]GFJ96073.1 hypothetical protein Prum_097150 [Phytohabitans rumicis]
MSRWPVLLVGAALVATATVEFLYYPLDIALWLLALVVVLGVWAAGLAAAVASLLFEFWRRGWRPAALLLAIAALGFTWIARTDLHLAYPQAYYWTHRPAFASGDRGEVRWMSLTSGIGYGYAYAPSAKRGQAIVMSATTVTATAALGDGWWWVITS